MTKSKYRRAEGIAFGIVLIVDLFFLLNPLYIQGQAFAVEQAKSAQDVVMMVDTVLLTGLRQQGLVSNIKFKGAPASVGYFHNGDYINVSRGLLMTSGYAVNAVGPNQKPFMTGDNGMGGDPDLAKLAGAPSYDACVIEFDFIPQSDYVSFKYVFGSEEYNKYVNSRYNDVFAFFVSGPGISGPFQNNAKNIALIPGTNEAVSINNVNCGQQANYRIPPSGPGKHCEFFHYNDQFPEVPGSEKGIEYNGYTVVFSAEEHLIPCQTYHMKLAICDISDHLLDSGVFLEAQSFDIGHFEYEVDYTHEDAEGVILNNCNEAELKIYPPEVSDERSLELFLSGDAKMGVDFEEFPLYYTFAPGDAMQTITIRAKEGMPLEEKHLTITVQEVICGNSFEKEFNFTFLPYQGLKIKNDPFIDAKCKEEISIDSDVEGGYGNIDYLWDGKAGSTQHHLQPEQETCELEVKDLCSSDHLKFNVNREWMSFGLKLSDDTICTGKTVSLMPSCSMPEMVDDIKWSIDGGSLKEGDSSKMENLIVQWDHDGKKKIGINVYSKQCGNDYKEKPLMVYEQPYAQFDPSPLEGCLPFEFDLTAEGEEKEGMYYQWTVNDDQVFNGKYMHDKIDSAGVYSVDLKVSNAGKCFDEMNENDLVKVYPDLDPKLIIDKDLLCGDEEVRLQLDKDTTVPGQEVEWALDGGIVQTKEDGFDYIHWNLSGNKNIVYNIKTSLCGDYSGNANVEVLDVPQPIILDDSISGCSPLSLTINADDDNGIGGFNYQWYVPGVGMFDGNHLDLELEQQGAYDVYLQADNKGYCKNETHKKGLINVYPNPYAHILPEQPLWSNVKNIDIYADQVDSLSSYFWTVNGVGMGDTPSFSLPANSDQKEIDLNVVNKYGCSSSDNKTYTFIHDGLMVPNAMVPGGVNNTFKVIATGIQDIQIRIFNRWGEEMFYSASVDDQWDGRFKGKEVPVDAYIVKIDYHDKLGDYKHYKGVLNVLK